MTKCQFPMEKVTSHPFENSFCSTHTLTLHFVSTFSRGNNHTAHCCGAAGTIQITKQSWDVKLSCSSDADGGVPFEEDVHASGMPRCAHQQIYAEDSPAMPARGGTDTSTSSSGEVLLSALAEACKLPCPWDVSIFPF